MPEITLEIMISLKRYAVRTNKIVHHEDSADRERGGRNPKGRKRREKQKWQIIILKKKNNFPRHLMP
jgi:hypothetical protein